MSVRLKIQFSFLVIMAIFGLTACGGGSSGEASASSVSGSSLEGGAVSAITFDANNAATIDFGSYTSTSEFVVALYSYNTSGATESFQFGNLAELPSLALLGSGSLDENITEDFHGQLRNLEANLEESEALSAPAGIKLATYSPALGTQRNFNVLSSFSGSSYSTVTTTLVYKSANNNFFIWLDNRDAGALDEADILELGDNFESIIEDEKDMFGEPSDIDSQAPHIVMTREVNEIGAVGNGLVTGFFYAVDLFSNDTYPQSNETEIFYTLVPDPSGDFGVAVSESFAMSNILPTVLPHEFQHMINFNMHYNVNSGSTESSFLNEALSHLAEDLVHSSNMAGVSQENPSRVKGGLASIDSLCFTCGSSLYQRGLSYLFVRYLYEQAELGNVTNATTGAQLVSNLLDTNLTGVNNLVNAVHGTTSNAEILFTELLGQFGLTTFLSNTGLSNDDRLGFTGINLRAAQNDNRSTILDGPAVTTFSGSITDTLASSGISFVSLTAADIDDNGGSIQVEMSTSTHVGGYVIQTGL